MQKGWRIALVTGLDETPQVFVVAIVNQSEAINRVAAGRSVRRVAAFPVSEEELRALNLVDGEFIESRQIN